MAALSRSLSVRGNSAEGQSLREGRLSLGLLGFCLQRLQKEGAAGGTQALRQGRRQVRWLLMKQEARGVDVLRRAGEQRCGKQPHRNSRLSGSVESPFEIYRHAFKVKPFSG